MSRQPLPDRERVFIINPLRVCRRLNDADAITENGMKLEELETHLKNRLQEHAYRFCDILRFLTDYVFDMKMGFKHIDATSPDCD